MFNELMQGAGIFGDIAGTILTNRSNEKQVQKTNDANAAQAQAQMDFQERMSNSAYQRAYDDMKKAGLNPIMAVKNGGASTPSGAAATMQAFKKDNPTAGLGDKLGAAVALKNSTDATDAEIMSKRVQAETAATQMDLNRASEAKARTDTMNLEQDTIRKSRENDIGYQALEKQKASARLNADTSLQQAQIDNKMAKFDSYNNRAQQGLSTAGSLMDLFKPKIPFKFGGGNPSSARPGRSEIPRTPAPNAWENYVKPSR